MNNKMKCSGSGFVTLDLLESGIGNEFPVSAGGSFGNVMLILAYLGWEAAPILRLGQDWPAQQIMENFKQYCVQSSAIQLDPSVNTPVIIQHQQPGKAKDHRFIHRCPQCTAFFPSYTPVKVTSMESHRDILQATDVYFFDRASPSAIRGAQIAKSAGAFVVFEPSSFGNEAQLAKAIRTSDVVKFSNDRSRDSGAESLCHDVICIETHGALGLRFRLPQVSGDHEWVWSSPVENKEIVDTSGAGDWTTAGMIHSMLTLGAGRVHANREILEASLRYGQALAALNCRFAGARGLAQAVSASEALLYSHMLSMGYSFHITERRHAGTGALMTASLDQICLQCAATDRTPDSQKAVRTLRTEPEHTVLH